MVTGCAGAEAGAREELGTGRCLPRSRRSERVRWEGQTGHGRRGHALQVHKEGSCYEQGFSAASAISHHYHPCPLPPCRSPHPVTCCRTSPPHSCHTHNRVLSQCLQTGQRACGAAAWPRGLLVMAPSSPSGDRLRHRTRRV